MFFLSATLTLEYAENGVAESSALHHEYHRVDGGIQGNRDHQVEDMMTLDRSRVRGE